MRIMTSCDPICDSRKDAAKIELLKKSIRESALLSNSREFALLAQESVRKLTGDSISGASLARLDTVRYQSARKLAKLNAKLIVLDAKLAVVQDDVKAVQTALRGAGEKEGEDTEASRHAKETPAGPITVIGNPSRGLVVLSGKETHEASSSRTNRYAGAPFLLKKIAGLQVKIYNIEREAIPLRSQRDALLATIREINAIESCLLSAMNGPVIGIGSMYDVDKKRVIYWMDGGNFYTRGDPRLGATASLRLVQVSRSWEIAPVDGKPLKVSSALRGKDSTCGGYPDICAFEESGAPQQAVSTYEGYGWQLPSKCPNTLATLFGRVRAYQNGLISGK